MTGEAFISYPHLQPDAPYMSFAQMFEFCAGQVSAEQVAIRSRKRSITYAELNTLANGMALQIRKVAGSEAFIITLLDDNIDTLIAILAISKAGCASVTLSGRQPMTFLQQVAEQVETSAYIVAPEHIEKGQELARGKPVLTIGSARELQTSHNLGIESRPEQPFNIVFTSGTSGTPKGILRTQAEQIYPIKANWQERVLTADDTTLYFGSLNHAGGHAHARLIVVSGGTMDLLNLKEETPESIIDWIVSQKVTRLATIPTVFRTIFHDPPTEPLSGIRVVSLGTEPVLEFDFQLFKRTFVPGAQLIHTYGSSELGGISSFHADHSTVIQGPVVPVGKIREGLEILIVDEALNPLAAGEKGEIVGRFQAGRFSPGYWKSPEQSEGKYLVDPNDPSKKLFRTGDLGVFLPDGNLVHLGRRDSMVKIRGFRVELSAVENALNRHPDVAEVAVQAVTQETVTKLVAYIVSKSSRKPAVSDIRGFLSNHLADFMIPSQFIFVDTIPRLPNGKLNTQLLPQSDSPIQVRPPVTPTETRLLPAFQKVLPVKTINRDDHFFDLGGDSLKVIRLIADINTSFGINLTPSIIYRHGTIEQLAAYIDSGQHTTSSLVAINPYGSQPLLLCVPGENGNALHFQQLVAELGHDYPLYAFQHPAYEPNAPTFDSTGALAAHYVALAAELVRGNDYYLGGVSVGGLIVFEMAQQLTAAGKQPLGVIMFDSHFPLTERDTPTRKAFLKARRRENIRQSEPLLRIRKQLYVARRTLTKQLNTLLDQNERTVKRVKAATRRSTTDYQPKLFSGKVFYLTCREDRLRNAEPEQRYDLAWKSMALGGLELFDTPGNHINMMDMPHVRVVARHIRQIIAAAQEQQT